MNCRTKKRWWWAGVAALLIALGFVHIPQHVDLAEAREIANRRFAVMIKLNYLLPSDFSEPQIQDRGDEWLFEWHLLKKGEGTVTVIVRRNGEIFDGDDVRLESMNNR